MNIRLAAPLQEDSIVDGEGLRVVIWTQGCSHNCQGCHNPSTHDFNGGYLEKVENIKKELDKAYFQDGITFSGGDPMFQAESCSEIAEYAKSLGKNIWCYTGFTFEDLLKSSNEYIKKFLNNVDILIDGKFEIENFSMEALYRGSTNQRIIDVQKSLKQNKCVLATKYYEETPLKEGIKVFI